MTHDQPGRGALVSSTGIAMLYTIAVGVVVCAASGALYGTYVTRRSRSPELPEEPC